MRRVTSPSDIVETIAQVITKTIKFVWHILVVVSIAGIFAGVVLYFVAVLVIFVLGLVI